MDLLRVLVKDIAKEIGLFGTVLTFRPLGKKAKTMIIDKIYGLAPNVCLELDFSGVDLCDVSFVDEIIIEVQLYLRLYRENLMFLSNLNKDIIDNLEAALALRASKTSEKIPVLYRVDSSISYLGSLEPNLSETLELLIQKRVMSARELAEIKEIAINNASNRLKKLWDMNLVIREEKIDSSGKQHIYKMPAVI